MKTKIMAIRTLPEQFKTDLLIINSISSSQLTLLAQDLSKIQDSDKIYARDTLLDIAKNTNLSAEKLRVVLRILSFMFEIPSQYDDNLDDFVDDLLSENIIPNEDADKLKSAIRLLADKPIAHLKPTAAKVYQNVLPVFQSAITRCLLLSRFEKEYTMQDNPETYTPHVAALMPGTVLNITVRDISQQGHYTFLLSEEDLNNFILRLLLAKNQMEALKSHIQSLKKE